MIDTSRRIKLTTSSGRLLHDVQFRLAHDLDDYERQRLFGIDPTTEVVTRCRCGWTAKSDDTVVMSTATDHVQRAVELPVHHVGEHTAIGSRVHNADSHASGVDDVTGVAVFAVADGIGSRPGAATAAAIAANTAVSAALTTTVTHRAVTGLLAARDALIANDDLICGEDTVMVMAVSRPTTSRSGLTWDIAWVGDCRAYLIEDDVLTLLTIDHTEGQYLRDAGVPEAVAARFDNIVVTTVGAADPLTLGTATVSTERGRLALLSDGIGKALTEADLLECLSTITDPQACAQHLVERGVDRLRADNATAVVIDSVPTA